MISILLSILVFAFYFLATIAFAVYLKNLSQSALRLGQSSVAIGVLLHFVLLIAKLAEAGIWVPTTPTESHLAITFFLGLGSLWLARKRSFLLLVVVLLPLISLGILFFHLLPNSDATAPLPSPWLWTHILLAIVGEALLCLGAGTSVVYLLAERQLKRRETSGIFMSIPSLADFDRFLEEILTAGFILLTLALGIGFIFANEYWKSNWYFDPKILFSVLIWLLYGILLGLRKLSPFYKGHRSAVIAVVGFVSVLTLSWGLDFHSSSSQHLNVPTKIQP